MKKLFVFLSFVSILLSACSNDDDIKVEKEQVPVIKLDKEDGTYTIKAGRELIITPTYEFVDDALFVWSEDDKVISKEPSLIFKDDKLGIVYLHLKVSTPYGSAEAELMINVVPLEIPAIALPEANDGFTIMIDSDLRLKPNVAEVSIPTTYTWKVDGQEVSSDKEYTFSKSEAGVYKVSFETRNEDGSDQVEFDIKVCTPEDMPFSWAFDQTTYYLSSGRSIRLMPLDIENGFDADYVWTVNGQEMQNGKDCRYIFSKKEAGQYNVQVTMKNKYGQKTQNLLVVVCPPEGTYKREKTVSSQGDWNKVYEFLPAPGQFINEDYTAETMEQAVAYAEERLRIEAYVSLGGFGGSIVFGFDHSIENSGDYDIAIKGNSFAGSSEPGIVWVMQDENGDGLPNDTWYELKGSETGNPETIQDYAVTYYRPHSSGMSVQWKDNQGNSGMIDYLPSFHRQDYYYPCWIKENSYTLRGTCLKARNYDTSGNGTAWVNKEFDWGYVDNFSSIDRLTDDDNYAAGANANHFKISHAITYDGQPANLKYIDFIKIQTGINAKSGWLGELSTEVFGIYDYHMKKDK